MANSWGKVEAVTDFVFLGSKITADSDCSHEIKRCLLLGRKVMTNLDSILKSRDITLLAKVHISQSYGFPSSHVWMCKLDHKEGWVPKNWCFRIVLEKTLESPFSTRRSNKSILKEINPKYSFEGLMLKLQYFGYLMWQTDSMAKTLMLGKMEGRRTRAARGWDGWMASPTQWTWVWANSRRQWKGSCLACCSPWGHKELDTIYQYWTNKL